MNENYIKTLEIMLSVQHKEDIHHIMEFIRRTLEEHDYMFLSVSDIHDNSRGKLRGGAHVFLTFIYSEEGEDR